MSNRPALGRPMDIAYRSNLFILIATPVIGTIAGLIALARSESLFDSAWWGYSAAGAGFLAWTIARELHPDRAWMATVATFIAPFGVLIARPDLFAVAVALLVSRAIAGTVGVPMRLPDTVLFLAVGGFAVFRDAAPGVLAFGAVGMVLVTLMEPRSRPWSVIVVVAYAIGATVAAFSAEVSTIAAEGWWVIGVGAALGAVALLGPTRVAVRCDIEGEISPARVRLARLIVLAIALSAAVTADPAVTIPAYAALAVTALRPT